MVRQLLIFLALLPFSIVSNAAAIPMDADQAVAVTTPNTVLHQDVMFVQGRISDKDVADITTHATSNACPDAVACGNTDTHAVAVNDARMNPHQAAGIRLLEQNGTSAVQPLVVLLMIIGLIVYFLSRKSVSTK